MRQSAKVLVLTALGVLLLGTLTAGPVAGAAAPTDAPPTDAPPPTGLWSRTGDPLHPVRSVHTATVLRSGQVLVAGGLGDREASDATATAELYDPRTGTWTSTGSMTAPRMHHTATLLPDGRVLVAGGAAEARFSSPVATAEVYDPRTGTWTATGPMTEARVFHRAVPIGGGRVLVAGGMASDTAEVYDHRSGTWSATGSMTYARFNPTLTSLPGGKVLVAGGGPYWLDSLLSSWQDTAEVYDVRTGSWTVVAPMNDERVGADAQALRGGQVLVFGGGNETGILASAEVYDPRTDTWRLVEPMSVDRFRPCTTRLADGRVLVAGGYSQGPEQLLASAEVYDYRTGTWRSAGSMEAPRVDCTASLVRGRAVLVTGGVLGGPNTAELWSQRTSAVPSS